jgi:2-phosphosulfolactate phosphatase
LTFSHTLIHYIPLIKPTLKFRYTDLADCHTAQGVVVVIDVLRVFSTAAYAFGRSAKEIILVSAVEEALALKATLSHSKAMGEVGGLRPEGFDFGNSPTHINEADLSGVTMIHRTSAGTQGVVRSQGAEVMLAASFVVADAAVRYISQLARRKSRFVITGQVLQWRDRRHCLRPEYLEELLKGNQRT